MGSGVSARVAGLLFLGNQVGELDQLEGVEIPPELREACHTVLSRSSDATTALGDTLRALRKIPTIAAEVEAGSDTPMNLI